MKHETLKGRLLRSSTLAGVAVATAVSGAPAFAQDDVEEIFITGSRIARPDLTSNSPVTIVDSEALELSGAINVEQMLHTLPQVVPGLNASSNNPSAQQGPGQVTVDLRGLGSTRTLVLVNGRRFSPSGNLGIVDINNIPASLIDRVDVVTGGTSAVYGSDALGGVVNFILKDDFQGVQFGTQVGTSGEGDASSYTMDVTMGGNFDRGNAVLYASYVNREGLTQGERDYSKNTFVGSATAPQSSIDGIGSFNQNGDGGMHAFNGCFPGWTCADGLNAYDTLETDRYNYAPPNYIILPQDRIVVEGFVNYDINDYVEFFADLAYINNRTEQQLAPTPATDLDIDYDFIESIVGVGNVDPLITASYGPGDTIPGYRRRMLEVGARIGQLSQNTLNMTMGFQGDIPWIDSWSYEVYYSYGRNESQINSFNNVNQLAFEDALSGCTLHNVPGCTALMPFNFFGINTLTPDQGDWLGLNTGETSTFERQTVSLLARGDLYELPAGPLAAALGFEYRKDNSSYIVDNDQKTGNIQGFNQSNSIFGAMDIAELYAEMVAPLWPNFELEAGYRYSQYSTAGSVNTWKVGASWQPIDDIRIRGTYNEATRAPNIFELFRAGDQNFPTYNDPCNDDATPPSVDQGVLCLAQGVPALPGFAQANAQTEAHEFGNPDLDPEESTSFTIGAVIQPRWVDNLTVTLDWYDIEVQEYIVRRSANTIINSCYNQSGASPLNPLHPDCLRMSRNAITGQLEDVNTTLGNAGTLQTSGLDVSLRYNWAWADTRWFSGLPGDMEFSAMYTYTDFYGLSTVGSPQDDRNNMLGTIVPEHKGSGRLTYNVNDWQLSWNADYLDELYDPYFGGIPGGSDSVWYHDLAVRWFPNDTYEASLVINNITDEQPPMLLSSAFASWGQANTIPAYYDPLGRYYRFGLKAKF
jgi:outer membrane receptor protein involved in Fe transport